MDVSTACLGVEGEHESRIEVRIGHVVDVSVYVKPCENTVVATGGSAVLKSRAAEHLVSLGKTVYISLPLAEIEKRITDLSSRGVAMSRGETLRDVYEKRIPIYQRYAHATVDISGLTIAESCAKVCETIKKLMK